MSTTKLRFLAIVGLAIGILGGAGAGIYYATAADPTRPVASAADQKLPPEAGTPPKTDKPTGTAVPATAPPNDMLQKPFGELGDVAISVEELLRFIEDRSDLVVRVDIAAFRRLGVVTGENSDPGQFLSSIYERKVVLPKKASKLAIRDVLGDALAQLPFEHPCTFQIRGNQLVIIPAYVPPVRPGVNPLDYIDDEGPAITAQVIREQIYGGVVSVSADQKPLTEVLADLRKQTGANIVLDPRTAAVGQKANLTIALGDVRLYDALHVIADLSDLKLVYSGNIYYITTAANAKTFLGPPKPTQAQLMGAPMTTLPPGTGLGGPVTKP